MSFQRTIVAPATEHISGPNRHTLHAYIPGRDPAPPNPRISTLTPWPTLTPWSTISPWSTVSLWSTLTQWSTHTQWSTLAQWLAPSAPEVKTTTASAPEVNMPAASATSRRAIDISHEAHWQVRHIAAHFILISALAVCAPPYLSSGKPNLTVLASFVAAGALIVFDCICFAVYPEFGTTYRMVDIAVRSGLMVLVIFDPILEKWFGQEPTRGGVIQIDIEDLEGFQLAETEDQEGEEDDGEADEDGAAIACQLRDEVVDAAGL